MRRFSLARHWSRPASALPRRCSRPGLLHEISSKVILAAAVIDDVLGLLVLAVVSSLTHGRLTCWNSP